MALINCPECSKKVSDKASSCPRCGYPIHNEVETSGTIMNENLEEPNTSLRDRINLKKIIIVVVILLAVVFLITLATGEKPATGEKIEISDKAVSIGKRAIEVVDAYLDKKISADSARSSLFALSADMEYARNYSFEERKNDKQKDADFFMSFDISALSLRVSLDTRGGDSESYNKIISQRNDLAKKVGVKIRK